EPSAWPWFGVFVGSPPCGRLPLLVALPTSPNRGGGAAPTGDGDGHVIFVEARWRLLCDFCRSPPRRLLCGFCRRPSQGHGLLILGQARTRRDCCGVCAAHDLSFSARAPLRQ